MAGQLDTRFDSELMHFDVPAPHGRGAIAEHANREAQDRAQRLAGADRIRDRLEPPLDPAEQPVVVVVLKMRLMGLARDRAARRGRVHSVAARTVPRALGQIRVGRQIVPARREGVPVR